MYLVVNFFISTILSLYSSICSRSCCCCWVISDSGQCWLERKTLKSDELSHWNSRHCAIPVHRLLESFCASARSCDESSSRGRGRACCLFVHTCAALHHPKGVWMSLLLRLLSYRGAALHLAFFVLRRAILCESQIVHEWRQLRRPWWWCVTAKPCRISTIFQLFSMLHCHCHCISSAVSKRATAADDIAHFARHRLQVKPIDGRSR